jgi:hypothetical protein
MTSSLPFRAVSAGLLVFRLVLATPSANAAEDNPGYRSAGWGAFVVPVPLAVQAQRDLDPGQGALVVAVRPGGTAASLGIQPGDVVLAINDTPIANRHDVHAVVASAKPGDAVVVTTVGQDGGVQALDGAFQARPARRPNQGWPMGPWPGPGGMGGAFGPPPWRQDPASAQTRQYEELLKEQRALSEAAAALDRVRDTLPSGPEPAWFVHVDIGPTTGSTTGGPP